MRESCRKHLEDILWDYGRKVDAYLKRREQIKDLLHPGGFEQRVSGGTPAFEGEKYVDMLNGDKQLNSIYRYIAPINKAIAKLQYHQRQIIELRYVMGMEQEDVMKEMNITLASYYREKRKAFNAIGWAVFGVYC